jgi:hypothetical protein
MMINLTNAQFPILNSHPTGQSARVHGQIPGRMRIENWELSIGQILAGVPSFMRGCLGANLSMG